MLLQRRSWCQVVIIESCGRQPKIDQVRVCLVKSRQHGIGSIYFLSRFVIDIKYGLSGDTDEYVPFHGKYLHIRILLQLSVNLFSRCCREIKRVTLLLHNLENTDFRLAPLDCGKCHRLIRFQKVKCFFHTVCF